jgi:hypothetical protein
MIVFLLCLILAPRDGLRKLTIQYELLDQRESVFVTDSYLESDFKLIMQRYVKLYDAPLICDCAKFQNDDITNIIDFNRKYCSFVSNQKRILGENTIWFDDTIKETNELFIIWDLVRDINCPYYNITIKRDSLKKLKIKLGDDAYYNGALPPCVPIWRFQRF